MNPKISLFSGIYAPETGGPAKFAQTFSGFASRQNFSISLFAYSSLPMFTKLNTHVELFLISNQISILKRFLLMIRFILNAAKLKDSILVNGSFWEIAIARHLSEFRYVAKVPGDIVWERLRNKGKTTVDIDNFQNESLGISSRILRYFFSFALRKAEWVIVPSSHLGKLCESWGVQKSRIVQISNSVLVPPQLKDSQNQKKFDFVTVCRLVPWKGVDEIIESVSELNANLLVIGDGPERDALEKQARTLHARVTFVGEIPPEDVSNYLIECSTFVLNSNFEATSYALIEAQAAGLLTIANEGTGSEEVITHSVTGLLCGIKSGLELSQAMKQALENVESNHKMRSAARMSVEKNFNLEINYRKILNLCIS
jgi:glycosyltransferase involved in cell wall biosynthesis